MFTKSGNIIFFAAVFIFAAVSCNYIRTDNEENGYNQFPFLEMEIDRLQKGYDSGEFTVSEVISAFLGRIEKLDRNGPELNSIISVNPDALKIAGELDLELINGKKRGPLHGVPVVLKDNIDTHDNMPTTAGSRALADSYPLKDSFVAGQLKKAGAVIIGKANLSEWANFRGELSSSGWSGAGGQTKNPWVLDRNPCGSSSGSAVAVSANLAMIAIGTETNGSIVCPSHATGIVGIKPTVGLVSRSGIIPIAWSMDVAGPMARTVRDAAITLSVLAGPDDEDNSTLVPDAQFYSDYTRFLDENGIEGKRIGFFTAPMGRNFKVDSLMYRAVEFFKSHGAEIIEIDAITAPNTASHAFRVMIFEYAEGLNSYFESLGPGAPVKDIDELIDFNRSDTISLMYFNQRYLEMASEIGNTSSQEYKAALAGMHKGSREEGIDRVMDEHNLDAIIAPTGSPAWKTDLVNGDSFQLGSSSPAAQAGYPNITLPMGYIDNLPVGISVFGRAWSEPVLLEIAYAYERGTMYRMAPLFLKTDKF